MNKCFSVSEIDPSKTAGQKKCLGHPKQEQMQHCNHELPFGDMSIQTVVIWTMLKKQPVDTLLHEFHEIHSVTLD